MSKMIFYTGKGLREMFKPHLTEEEKANAEQLKKLNEKTLMKSGHISKMLLTNIKESNNAIQPANAAAYRNRLQCMSKM